VVDAIAANVGACDDLAVSRFLIVVFPLQRHPYPMLAIGQELVRNGHEVAWCGEENLLRPLVGPDVPVHATVDVAVTEYRPDVVVVEQHALAGGLVAHQRGVPWATVATGTLELTPPADLPELAGFADEPGDPRFAPHLVIALTTPGLVGTAELPDRCVLTGAALGTRPDAPDFPWHAWDPAARHVLVTTGSLDGDLAADFHRRMAAAVAPMAPGVQAVFVTSTVAADSLPDNAIIAERVPMLDLMPALHAVVCHAGGTVDEALAYGVPLVVAPVAPEQVATARQVTAAGAGIEVSMSDTTTADLAAAVRAVLDEPDYRDHAAVIAAEFAAAGGAGAAAGHLAALAAGTSLSQNGQSRWVNVLRSKKFSMADEFVWARHSHAELRATGGDFDLVVPLRDGGAGPALFCAPPLVGASWCYLALLPHIGPDHPVYGLQLRTLRRPEPLPVDMAELARDFADQIRITQPHGPYHLFGWSLGGNIAHAIAEELERRGAQVGLLAIGDATPDLPQHIRVVDDDKLWMLCAFVLRRFGYQPVIEPDDPDPMARMLAVIRGRPGLALHEWPDRRILALPRAIRNSIAVAQDHRPGRVHGRVLFVASTQTTTTTTAKLASWGDHLGGTIDVVEVDCRHEHLLNPGPVARIGAEIAARLGR
jgi:thioesterase domain-containing protein/UDP:flavonoid glycosyltransferase YjiC (YdhE family)